MLQKERKRTDTPPHGQIVGIDSQICTNEDEQRALLYTHYQSLRKIEMLTNIPIVFIVENNYGFEYSHMETMMSGPSIRDVKIFRQKSGPGAKAGVCKTEYLTTSYMTTTRRLLASDAVHLSDRLFTHTNKMTTAKILAETRDQFYRFRFVFREARIEGDARKFKLTGKTSSAEDDICIAAMQGLHFGMAILSETEYEMYRTDYIRNGIEIRYRR